jgi:hypothetical protein
MGWLCDWSLLAIAETRSSMPAKRDVTMRAAVLLIACLVFATFLTLDTGALLSWALSWTVSGVAQWWALLLVPLAVVVAHVGRQRRRSAPVQPRASRCAGIRSDRAKTPANVYISMSAAQTDCHERPAVS